MKRLPPSALLHLNNRLVKVWLHSGTVFKQGKRQGRDCPLFPDEVRAYVGPPGQLPSEIACLRQIMANRNIGRSKAKALLARAKEHWPVPARSRHI